MKPAMPALVATIRASICARCDAPCDWYRAGRVEHADPAAACPRVWPGRWDAYDRPGAYARAAQPGSAMRVAEGQAVDALAGASPPRNERCRKRRASPLIGPLQEG